MALTAVAKGSGLFSRQKLPAPSLPFMGGPKRPLRPRVGLTCNGCNGFGGKTSDEALDYY